MDLPKSLKIGYRKISLEPKDMEDVGEFLTLENKIIYNNKVTPPELINTVLHESLHAIFADRLVDIISSKKEETVVNTLANGIMSLLIDNPNLLKYINKHLND